MPALPAAHANPSWTHHFVLTLKTGPGLESAVPVISAPSLGSANSPCRLSWGTAASGQSRRAVQGAMPVSDEWQTPIQPYSGSVVLPRIRPLPSAPRGQWLGRKRCRCHFDRFAARLIFRVLQQNRPEADNRVARGPGQIVSACRWPPQHRY